MKLFFRLMLFFGLALSILGLPSFDESRYPTVAKGIRATLLPDKKSIRLDWDAPRTEGELIVARSNVVIDTAEKLYIADSLGRFKSTATNSTIVHFDYNLKPGNYYYAVVMIGDVRRREVKLFPNQNFTTTPILVEEENLASTPMPVSFPAFPDGVKQERSVSSVSGISASVERRNIRISWIPPENAVAGRTLYTIYRSTSPLTSLPLLQRAEKLTEVSHPSVSFLDQDLERSQTLYYGVSVKEIGGEESLPLEDKKSTLRVFYIRPQNKSNAEILVEEPKTTIPPPEERPTREVSVPPSRTETSSDSLHVRGLGYERVGKGAVISWIAPDGADSTTLYTLYASIKPLNNGTSSFNSGTVVRVANIEHPKTNFYIKELKEIEDLYFGVTAKSATIPEDFNLRENISYFRYDFARDLVSPTKEADMEEQTRPQTPKEQNQHLVEPASLRPEEPKSKPESSLALKEEKKATVTYDLAQTDLSRILRETVLKKKYEVAIYRLEEYLKAETDPFLRGKASLFLGISYLKMGNREKALRLFLRRETKAYSPERTEFWTNVTLGQMGKGNL